MKVTKALNTTTKCVRDSWGKTIVNGSELYDGLCYYFVGTLHYKPVPKRCAVVPAASLLYVCSEIEAKSSVVLPVLYIWIYIYMYCQPLWRLNISTE